MRATPCLSRSFWGRSVDELRRLTNIAFKLEGIKGATTPLDLQSFRSPDSIAGCKVMSDVDIGGYSEAHLDWVPTPASSGPHTPTHGPSGYARFHGTISTQLPRNRPEIERSGYAAWRTLDRGPTIFGRSLWNIDPYVYLALRVKSDGRSYFVNVQTESVVPTDLHQHRLFSKRPGEWETVLIKWNDFVRTNHGFVVEPQTEILRQKVKTVGIGLTDRIPGPFDLCIERIWATNDPTEADSPDVGAAKEGELKNKHGQKIKWARE
ncbi:CIA30-domain-containing protein [Pleurostoma richardsiae]|uniref:CIA30-domain-containing protein n=1 Tax=Pleurostoma richardsiae TaxID=41990 RepID=A0AA38VYX1_9PEZI|nr:CIA30-domain-containing protein [Pleurostoma richardsiae]